MSHFDGGQDKCTQDRLVKEEKIGSYLKEKTQFHQIKCIIFSLIFYYFTKQKPTINYLYLVIHYRKLSNNLKFDISICL